MMFCNKCGNEIGEGDAVCPKCGAAVKTPEQEAKKPRKKMFVFLGVGIVIVIAAVAFICYINSAPYLYKTAVSCFNEGDYVRAEEIFSHIGDYQDSAGFLAECKYRHAQECLENGDYDQALALLNEYEASPDYETTRESYIALCKEKIADAYRSRERYEDAVALYQVLGMTWETAEMYAAMGNYVQALAITQDYSFGDGSEKEARKSWCRAQAIIYIQEAGYEDAWKCLQQYDGGSYDDELCPYAYQLACAFADGKKYEEVLYIAGKIKGHMGNEAKQLESTCYEAQGIECAQKEDYETAWKYFAKCEITDAGCPYLYKTGRYYMEKGAYSDAYSIWKALGDYEDSAEMMRKAQYECAKAASAQGDYELALQILQTTGNSEESQELIKETYQAWAKAVSAQGDYELAVQILQKTGNSEESRELIKETYQAWAKAASAQNNYNVTMSVLQKFQGCEDNVEMVKKAYYDCAETAYRKGNYELAISVLETLSAKLGDYEGSAELAAEAEEKIFQKSVEEENKARRGILAGTWKTDNGNLRIEAAGADGRLLLRFKMAIERKSVTTMGGTSYGDIIKCGLDEDIFKGANSSYTLNGNPLTLTKEYFWDNWDYKNETLYLHASGGGWKTCSCTVSGSSMTLKMGGKTFKLTKN